MPKCLKGLSEIREMVDFSLTQSNSQLPVPAEKTMSQQYRPAFVLLLLKLHQREFPKAAGKQVNKAGIKPPCQGCTVSLDEPRGLKNALKNLQWQCTEGQAMGRRIFGKSRSLPCAEADWSYTRHQHQKHIKSFLEWQNQLQSCFHKQGRKGTYCPKAAASSPAQQQGWLHCWNSGRCWAGCSLQLDFTFRWCWSRYLFA